MGKGGRTLGGGELRCDVRWAMVDARRMREGLAMNVCRRLLEFIKQVAHPAASMGATA